jgi:hypothetical protein
MVAHESIKLVPIDSTITAVGSVSSVGLESALRQAGQYRLVYDPMSCIPWGRWWLLIQTLWCTICFNRWQDLYLVIPLPHIVGNNQLIRYGKQWQRWQDQSKLQGRGWEAAVQVWLLAAQSYRWHWVWAIVKWIQVQINCQTRNIGWLLFV